MVYEVGFLGLVPFIVDHLRYEVFVEADLFREARLQDAIVFFDRARP